MASRKTSTETVSPVEAFVALQTFEATEADPVSNGDLADDQKWDHTATFKAMEILADAELVDSQGRGLTTEWFILTPDVTAENAESIAQEALKGFTPPKPVAATKADQERTEGVQRIMSKVEAKKVKDAEARERLEYAVRAAESQDGVISQAPEFTAETLELPTHLEGSGNVNEEWVSLSVDAPKVAAAVEALIEKLKTLPDKGLDQFVDAETGDMVYESSIEKNGLKLDEPSEVLPCPAGVNANVWDLANTAITQTARDYWAKIAKQDAEEYAANNGAPAPF
jgi:hypothetical protein